MLVTMATACHQSKECPGPPHASPSLRTANCSIFMFSSRELKPASLRYAESVASELGGVVSKSGEPTERREYVRGRRGGGDGEERGGRWGGEGREMGRRREGDGEEKGGRWGGEGREMGRRVMKPSNELW